MEHLIADGEGNYLNLRYARILLISQCDNTPSCMCDGQDKWHAVAWLTDDVHFTFNAAGLPSREDAVVLLDRLWRESVEPPIEYATAD